MDAIVGRIAAIKDEYTVVLNVGYKQNVEEGMKFVIYNEEDEIKDPVTGKSLGCFEDVKAKVEVDYVAENYSTAKSIDTWMNPFSYTSSFAALASLAAAGRGSKAEIKQLPLDDETKERLLKRVTDKKTTVKIGDLVRQIIS